MDVNKDSLDVIEKISGWIWAVLIAVFAGLGWMIKKVVTASKFIMQVEDHQNQIKEIAVKIEQINIKVDCNKNSADNKLDMMLDIVRSDAESRAKFSEERLIKEAERAEQEKERHAELMNKISIIGTEGKLHEERRKNTHSLLEVVKSDLKLTNKKFDETVSKVDKTISFVDGKYNLNLSEIARS